MNHPTRLLTRRQQGFVLHSMHLTGEVAAPPWSMQVEHRALVRAVGMLSGRVVLTVCDAGLSLRSGSARVDVAGVGFWASPVVATASRLRRGLACAYGRSAQLEFAGGRLFVNASSMPAWEI